MFREQIEFIWALAKSLCDDKRGEVGAGVVGTLVGIMVSLLLAIVIVQNLINSQTPDSNWSANANSTWSSLQSNIWTAITLLVIVPIIVGAVIILSYVRRGM